MHLAAIHIDKMLFSSTELELMPFGKYYQSGELKLTITVPPSKSVEDLVSMIQLVDAETNSKLVISTHSAHNEVLDYSTVAKANEEINSKEAILGPNPTTGVVNIYAENVDQVAVYKLTGENVEYYSNQHSSVTEVVLAEGGVGVFIIEYSVNGEMFRRKVLKIN